MASFQFGANTQPTTQPATTGFALSQPQQQQAKGFSYVAPASTGGFNFGTPATTSSTGFTFGAPATTSATTGLSFGTPANTSSTPGFSFGVQPAVPAQPAAPSGGFPFGQPATTAATTGFGFGQPTPATTAAPSTGFGFGQPAPVTTASTGFLFGVPNTSVGSSGFNFSNPGAGSTTTTAGMGFTFSTTPASTFGGFGAPTTTPASTFGGFGAPTTTPGGTSAFGFGTPSSATTTGGGGGGFSLGNTQPPSSNTNSAFNFGPPKSTAPVITPSFGFGMTSTPASTTSAASNTPGSFAFGTATSTFGGGFAFTTKPAAATTTAPTIGFGTTPVATAGSSVFTPGQMTTAPILNAPGPFIQGTTIIPTTSATTTTSVLGSNLVSASTAPSGFALNTTPATSFGNVASSGGTSAGFMTTEAPKTAAFTFPLSTPAASSTGTVNFSGSAAAVATSNTSVLKPTLSFTTPTAAVAPVVSSLPPASQADQAKVPSLTTTVSTSIPSSATSGFSFPSSAAPATITSTLTTGFPTSVGSSLKAPATTSGPSLLSTSIPFSSASSPFVGFGTTTSVSLSTATTVTASSAAGAALTTTTTVTPASAAPPATMNFRQLEDIINKWKIELEEQERVFLNQATQVNAWDRLLISNGEKITELNEAVERVKLDQQRLDHELDFILAQQRELEELLVPLEKSVESTPNIHHQQHADLEREHTYRLAENIDAQLKRMAEDIKEIIEHLNSSNKAQDDNDPIQQIGKILNAHMDALQWVDQNTAVLRRKLDETSKLYESHRRDHEKSFRVGFS